MHRKERRLGLTIIRMGRLNFILVNFTGMEGDAALGKPKPKDGKLTLDQ